MYMYLYDRIENVTIIIGLFDFLLFDNVLSINGIYFYIVKNINLWC